MTYVVTMGTIENTLAELMPLYAKHYAEMSARLESVGVKQSPFNPRVDAYSKASEDGWLLTFVLRHEGQAVGYCNVYVTQDMHNRDVIAQEDTIYVLPEHRNGAGRMLARAVHDELRRRGVLRLNVTTSTDLRVSKWLARQGYRTVAYCMTLNLQDERHVSA